MPQGGARGQNLGHSQGTFSSFAYFSIKTLVVGTHKIRTDFCTRSAFFRDF